MADASNPPGDIPKNVRTFLLTNIDSVGLLETLLILHEQPNREWTPDEINLELRSTLGAVKVRLARLRGLRLASRSAEGRYRYAPDNETKAIAINDLAGFYRQYRLRVIDLLLSNLNQLRDFSDSFRLWEDKDDDR